MVGVETRETAEDVLEGRLVDASTALARLEVAGFKSRFEACVRASKQVEGQVERIARW